MKFNINNKLGQEKMVENETLEKLIEKQFEMKEKAYCPYSKFHVGAALLAKQGKIYGGMNIENS